MTTERIEITLDGKKLMVDPGRTILETAQGEGIVIPTLCHDPRLEPFASCWVCLVKVERAKGFVPACGTRVFPGMVVTTSSADVLAARRMALELLLSNHYGDCKAPCTLTCPSNVDVQGYLGLIANGRFPEAVELIRRDNPMPAVIGRICPRPCESQCRRRLVEEPVNINGLKRFVADLEAQAGGMPGRPRPPRMGKKVAIVGAGPAGLSAAWYLTEKGVEVTLFEAMEKAGGMLRYGIPDYRLPPEVLDRTIAEMLGMGAELKTGAALGRDYTLEDLREGHDAVILALGAWKSRALRIPGEDHRDVLSGIEFLKDVNAGMPVQVGERVAVIGGGNTALDAARCSLRLGAGSVTIYYRRTREEMPASDAEIEEALEEGIELHFLAAPLSIEREGDRLASLTLLAMELGEPDASGRRRPVPVDGSEYSVPIDTVISAVGQYADTRILESIPGLVDGKGNLRGDLSTGCTAEPGIFAAGDLLTGTDIAIRAVAGGKHAARSALAFLEGRIGGISNEFLSRKSDFHEPSSEDFTDTAHIPREKPAARGPRERAGDFAEIESPLTREQALAEASRCLECGCQDVTECRLKEFATEYRAGAKRFAGETARHPIDDSHPFISRDPSKCILCGSCVRICLEVQGIGVFGYMFRGFSTVIAPSFGVPFGRDSSCISCGQCVSACPVGALTEKLPAGKTAPLPETVEEGFCSLCSMSCALEYRYHGSLFTRTTERFEPPNNGKLCQKGKFGNDFLNRPVPGRPVDADGAALSVEDARQTARWMLAAAKKPIMRISPYLCGEAMDAFLLIAEREKIDVQAAGLEGLDSRWIEIGGGASDSESGFFGSHAAPLTDTVCILVGDIATSNNVAFTEAYRRRREGSLDLWICGQDSEVSRRTASRVAPELSELGKIIEAASTDGKNVEILVNPEEIHAGHAEMEKLVVDVLLDVKRDGKGKITLLWNARNAGYLLSKLPSVDAASHANGSDLTLDVGVEDADHSGKRIVWGKKASENALFIPLPHELWIRGRSYPSGRSPLQVGSVDEEGLKTLSLLL
jgi:formate dehydrogenase major subunit